MDQSEKPGPELHERLRRRTNWKTVALRLLGGSCLLAAFVWFGKDMAHEIKGFETWMAAQGPWGKVAYVGMAVVLTSMLVPDTLLAVAAGALFGLAWGTALTVIGAVLAAALDFLAARTLLRPRIESMLEKHPKLRAIRAAANNEGIRLQLLLRLAPLNPVSVSYVLGASGVRFPTFLLATVGLVPGLFAEVYFGYLASHVTQVAGHVSDHSRLHTIMTIAGFLVCIVLIVYISRVAVKALADAEGAATADATIRDR